MLSVSSVKQGSYVPLKIFYPAPLKKKKFERFNFTTNHLATTGPMKVRNKLPTPFPLQVNT